MKKASLTIILLVLVTMCFTTITFLPESVEASALYVGGTGPGNYTTIQGAIDDADSDDTIHVYSGTYHEQVLIWEPLSLVGEDRDTTIIDGGPALDDFAVVVLADRVTITGFTITSGGGGFEGGVFLNSVLDCTLTDISVSDTGYGIEIKHSTGNTIANVVVMNNWYGIRLMSSGDNTIANSTVSNNKEGIQFIYSNTNTITNNTVSHNDEDGIRLHFDSSNNIIYHNNFIGNTNQAYDDGTNLWDDGYPSGGNYWNDYMGSDEKSGPNQDQPGSDEIGDVPYDIQGGTNKDRYPLVYPTPTVPIAPTGLMTIAGNEQVTLTWSAPFYDGGSPITNYIIYRGTVPNEETLLVTIGNVLTYVDIGVTNGVTYYYKVAAVNGVGKGTSSTRASATPVNLFPVCNITAPMPGITVSAIHTITGTANDTDGTVESVEIRIDDGQWMQVTGTTSWTYDWNTTTVSDGNHTIYARSYDGTNHSDEVDVSVVVDNAIPQPQEGEESIFEQIWFWVAIVVVIAILLLLFILVRRRKESRAEKQLPETQIQEEP
ncbi:MAG: right-handed parallel beta-helix repeat-containing protein [Thermoplasmata archaeon]|nr:right-handed parallel beta-helix repeat-containing protein [Thermoplasmata archaeon]